MVKKHIFIYTELKSMHNFFTILDLEIVDILLFLNIVNCSLSIFTKLFLPITPTNWVKNSTCDSVFNWMINKAVLSH